jgi:protein-S-isoprenylcysteine O-methyltransferase Ste14
MAVFPRIILVIVGSAAYFGLAILGWGGPAAFFSHPALVALGVAMAALAGVSLFAGGSLSPGVREDRSNRWVITAFALLGLLNGFLPAYADRLDFWSIDGDSTRWLGVLLFAIGGALRIWPVFLLGHRFSIYSVIRHPSYLGLLTNSLGWALAFRSGVGVVITALLLPIVLARIRAEEALLGSQFGAEYEAYRARTSRLIPGLY